MQIKLAIILLLLPIISQADYFVSIKSNNANLRVGPSTNYPIEWVYIQKNIPVKILEKEEQWRKIQDIEGTSGWIHQSLLSNTRYLLTTHKTDIYTKPDTGSKITAHIEKNVLGKLITCNDNWCKINTQNTKGWIQKKFLWGTD